jgi:DNA repair protein RadC
MAVRLMDHDRAPAPSGDQRLIDRLFAPLRSAGEEVCAFAYFSDGGRFLGMRHIAGTRSWVTLSVRAVARDVLAFDAVQVVMAHNHPSGEPHPSPDDIAATRRLARALALLEARLVDHLVIGDGRIVSFRQLGLV